MLIPLVKDLVERKEEAARKRKKYIPEAFNGSSFGQCLARQLFKLAGFDEEISFSGRTLTTFDLGDAVEELETRNLRETGFPVFAQQHTLEITSPVPLRGKIDGFIVGWDKRLVPLEIKSSGDYGFKKWLKFAGQTIKTAQELGWAYFNPKDCKDPNYRPILDAQPTYYWQAQSYLHAMNQKGNDKFYQWEIDPSGVLFLVLNKNDSTRYEEFVPYDKKAMTARLRKAKKGWDIFNALILQEDRKGILIAEICKFKEYKDRSKYPCKGCPYEKICWDKESA